MNNRKIVLSLAFTLLGVILVSSFWKLPLILSILLIFVTYIKHKIIPIKKESLWFVISGAVGVVGESLIMSAGPWVYTRTDFINFPLWLLFLWGYAGTLGISLYQGVVSGKD